MKRSIILLLCLISSLFTFGQEKNQMNNVLKGFEVVPPKFAGEVKVTPVTHEIQMESISDYISQNVQYPQSDIKYMVQGTEVVKFKISANGEIKDYKIVNSVSSEIDEEVLRVLETTKGMWIPGNIDKNPVEMEKEISVVFKLSGLAKNQDFNYLSIKFFSKGNDLFFTKNNPQKALEFYNKGIVVLPNEKGLLMVRGLANYELGHSEAALRDWYRIKELGGFEGDIYLEQYGQLKGYPELLSILQK